ncbi:hypothetical protein AMAG_14648 [Allomyces macrogynus ATCC 38327]|uniref:Peptidase M20 dimerisation domain-containing protein n=1 Tax=Allomyces macrogynus (strain ATCC 38327) TaxID=578462 RepID=A0A0L0T7K4_ALLM3|nr:hypothetical protein AMAG_14648 [Allomyces macrogynus ATCC 38327]|eukprot:KNE70524.1 hypothetical protein AMAG_14648 [Allomyces macrogynus ATCC 38327]
MSATSTTTRTVAARALATAAAHSGSVALAAAATAVAALTAGVVQTNRTISAQAVPLDPRDAVHTRPDDVQLIGERLATMVRFKTVSWDDDNSSGRKCAHHHDDHDHEEHEPHHHHVHGELDPHLEARIAESHAAILGLLEYLRATYPLIHSRLHIERVNTYSLLITWRGSEDGGAHVDSDNWRDPVHGATLLMAHSDVVPVPAGTESKWKHPPFDGHIDEEGFVWGRGSMDDKGNLIILLEAAERLLMAGYWPSRTIYIASGHDEEIGGFAGSAQIAARLQARGVESLAMVVDEGTMCVQTIIRGLDPYRIALVGVAEKGSLTLKMTAHRKADGAGHASMPSPDDPVVVLGKAIAAIEARERRTNLDAGVGWMSRYLVPYFPPVHRFVMSNLWLFRKVVARVLQSNTKTAATMQTTVAFTMLDGSPKINVIPDAASAFMDVRIAAGETADSVTADLRAIAAHVSPQLVIEPWGNRAADPSPVSTMSPNDPYFSALSRVLRGMYRTHRTAQEPAFRDAVVAPTMLMGNTDTRHFVHLARRIYRTSFFLMWTHEQIAGFHGVNERLQAENVARGVSGMMELMRAVGEMPKELATSAPAPVEKGA